MIVENFSHKLLNSSIRNTYVATAFFATLIFFVINANSYTPIEMLFGVTIVTIAFKGLSNMMVSLVILLFNLDNKEEQLEFEKTSQRINGLLNELSLQQTKLKTSQNN